MLKFRRKLVVLVSSVLLMVSIATIVVLLFVPKSDPFLMAVENVGLRQGFVEDTVHNFDLQSNLGDIVYVDTPEEKRRAEAGIGYTKEALMVIEFPYDINFCDIGKPIFKGHLLVLPRSFDTEHVFTIHDFRSSVKHELQHLEQLQTWFVNSTIPFCSITNLNGVLNEALLIAFLEMEAISLELEDPKISNGYRKTRYSFYVEKYASLWEVAEEMDPVQISNWKIQRFPIFAFQSLIDDYEREKFKHPPTSFPQWSFTVTKDGVGKQYTLSAQEVRQILLDLKKEGSSLGVAPTFFASVKVLFFYQITA